MQVRLARLASLSASIASSCCLVAFSTAQYAPPTVTVPGGQNGPGAWPYRASASTMEITLPAGTTLGGSGSDDLKVQFLHDGPTPWSEMRHNEGDIAMGIGPFDPVAALPPNAFGNYAPSAGPSGDIWRVNQAVGIALATVRVNGRDNLDTFNTGDPVGTVYGVANFNNDFGQGNSFNMLSGEFRNGGLGSSDLQIGLAGLASEGVVSVSSTFLPYGEGWLGGWVSATIGANGESSFDQVDDSAGVTGQIYTSASPALQSTDIVWQANGTARLTPHAPGSGGRAFTPASGMIFGSSTSSGNDSNIFAVNPRGDGWDVTIREDYDDDPSFLSLENQFLFTYVDYDAPGLVGGHADGDNGGTLQQAGSFTLTRTSEGTYSLQIPGKTEDDGTLLLTVADSWAGDSLLGDSTFLSYEWNAGTSSFIIESREVTDVFNDVYSLRDSDFYFAFADFNDPFQAWLDGDANADGTVSGADFTIWADNFGATNAHWFQGDWNRDGVVTGADFTVWADSFGDTEGTLLAPVPEPSGVVLLALAALGLWGLRKRS